MGHASTLKRTLGCTWVGLCLLAAACTSSAPARTPTKSATEPLPEAETREYRACATDQDCVYATNGCCDCANGGEDIAVHRDRLDAFRAEFSCNVPCTEVGAVPPCGSGKTSCEAGLCTYRVATDDTQ